MAKRHHTPLNKRKKQGTAIKSPLHILGDKIGWSSWKDDHLPDMMWACMATGQLSRHEYIELFRQIAARASKKWKDVKHIYLTHAGLSNASYLDFEFVFEPLKSSAIGERIISTLARVEALPDANHWKKLSSQSIDSDEAQSFLSSGIATCLDHQSQESTDVRWLKVFYLLISDRLVLPNRELADQFLYYPDRGDMKKVRPTIRAAEMSTRVMVTGVEKPAELPIFPVDAFWAELYQSSSCLPAPSKQPETEDKVALSSEISSLISQVMLHFYRSVKNTNIDPRLDGSFGICLYVLHLALETSSLPSSILSSGRIVLRAIVECCITLHFLTTKDEYTIWTQYRNYGSGQSALSFLKTIDLSDAPDFVDLDALEALANEDSWFETKDIAVGHWADKNLRQLAIECDRKQLYDKYYDWLSGFSHGHWGAIRDTSFTLCLNPLHRLHRIPIFGHAKPSVLSDICKLANLMLEDLNQLYPTFKLRIAWHKATTG